MNALKDDVVQQSSWLLDALGFRIVAYDDYPEHFDDGFVRLESARLNLQIVRDRGEIRAEISSTSALNTWWDLHWIGELIPDCAYPAPTLDGVSGLLRSNIELLSDFFGPRYRATARELRRREEERKQHGLKRFGMR